MFGIDFGTQVSPQLLLNHRKLSDLAVVVRIVPAPLWTSPLKFLGESPEGCFGSGIAR